MRILLLLLFGTVCFGQPASIGGFRIMNYDWNFMPNIVCNIINAARQGSPGLVYVNGEFSPRNSGPNRLVPLVRVSPDETNNNRRQTCEFPANNAGSYCGKLARGEDMGERYAAIPPPTLQSNAIDGGVNADAGARVPGREIFRTASPQPLFMSCDEYPFASTKHEGNRVRLSCVPDIEQEFQRRLVLNFYQGTGSGDRCRPGDEFYVGVYNVPQQLVNGACHDFCTSPNRPYFGFIANAAPYSPTADEGTFVCFERSYIG